MNWAEKKRQKLKRKGKKIKKKVKDRYIQEGIASTFAFCSRNCTPILHFVFYILSYDYLHGVFLVFSFSHLPKSMYQLHRLREFSAIPSF